MGEGEKIRWKSRGIEIKTGTSLANCSHRQNRLKEKNNLLSVKIELDGEKQSKNLKSPSPLCPLYLRLVFTPSFQTPLPPPFPRCPEGWQTGGLWSVCNNSCLLLFSPHTPPLLQRGASPQALGSFWAHPPALAGVLHSYSVHTCSSRILSRSCRRISALWMEHLLLLTLVLEGLFLSLALPLTAVQYVLFSLAHAFPTVPPARLRGSAVPCAGFIGASWDWGSPGIF